ncbi:MAG TPA: radical SAM protein [Caldisericia bacterium]|nr:radical SAM protein [Caldisericia bacterium]
MKTFGFQWHITDYCNLRCRHCYQIKFDKSSDLPLEKIKFIVDKISETLKDKKISVNITGGEPFLREDLFDILYYIEKKNNFKEINIITNGTILNGENIKILDKIKKFKYLKLSVESYNKEKNDFIRGKGNLEKVIENIKLFKGLSNKKLIIMITLSMLNYKDLIPFFEFSKDLKVDGVILERFVPLDRGKGIFDSYLRKDEWKDIIRQIIYFLDLNISPEEVIQYKAFWVDLEKNRLKGALCNLGDESMAIMPDGTIFPCRRLPILYGNILKDDLEDVLKKLKELKDSLKNNLNGKCKNCEIDCVGCRALTYAVTGDVYEEDPQCFL